MGSGLSTDTANKEWDELTKEEQIKILESGYVTSYVSVAEEDGQWVDFDDNHRVRQPTISDIPDIAKSMFQGYSQKLKKKFGDEDIDGHTPEEMIKREHELMAGQPKEKSKKEFTLKDYERNEGRNAHTLNALNLVKKYGTPEEIKEMEEIKDRHDKSEHGINHD